MLPGDGSVIKNRAGIKPALTDFISNFSISYMILILYQPKDRRMK